MMDGWWMRIAGIGEVKIPVSLELLCCKKNQTMETGKWVGKLGRKGWPNNTIISLLCGFNE